MKTTNELVSEAKQVLQLAAMAAEQKGEILELCYSGGKDSEVMRCLALDAGIKFEPIYKQTTIDRPYTTAYCKERNVTILRPAESFLQMMKRKGAPTRRCRWCCERLKEYKVRNTAVVGVRRAESRARSSRYTDYSQCRVYHRGGSCEQYFPLLNWTDGDMLAYILYHNIPLHPHYYVEGSVDISRRLGCIGCPLRGDNGKSDFMEFPKMLRQWLISLGAWYSIKERKTTAKFSSPAKLMIHNLFCRSYKEYVDKYESGLWFSDADSYMMLQNYFHIYLEDLVIK